MLILKYVKLLHIINTLQHRVCLKPIVQCDMQNKL